MRRWAAEGADVPEHLLIETPATRPAAAAVTEQVVGRQATATADTVPVVPGYTNGKTGVDIKPHRKPRLTSEQRANAAEDKAAKGYAATYTAAEKAALELLRSERRAGYQEKSLPRAAASRVLDLTVRRTRAAEKSHARDAAALVTFGTLKKVLMG